MAGMKVARDYIVIGSGLAGLTLGLAVKTPLELLSTSSHLSDKRHELEGKVLNMELEVLSLEEKYKDMVLLFTFLSFYRKPSYINLVERDHFFMVLLFSFLSIEKRLTLTW